MLFKTLSAWKPDIHLSTEHNLSLQTTNFKYLENLYICMVS